MEAISSKWVRTGKHQWMRRVGDVYKMCQYEYSDCSDSWFAWSGEFSINDYDLSDIEWALECHGHKIGDVSDDELASFMFENQAADFYVMQYYDEQTAVAFCAACRVE